ncbi:hypothetical protein J6590_007402 [Homalodisca vitripennis]|nr:hypothetical protein J6590_007402 [Homalodisca vitripennis]
MANQKFVSRREQDVIFHNEAYSQSSSSPSSSADTSPEHQHQSATAGFMSAVLNAIRTATSSRLPNTEPSSDAEPMLSSEPEPSAFGHRDVTTSSSPQDMEKRYSITSLGSLEVSPSKHSEFESEACGGRLENSESLHNLSLAILRRQQLEAEEPMALPPVPAHTLVDQVIEVDNLVTRLLKVIRIVQQANDNSALQERKKLSDSLTETEAQMISGEQLIAKLTCEVQQLRDQLQMAHSAEVRLGNSKEDA